MQDETLLHRLPFLALYSLSQSRCLLFVLLLGIGFWNEVRRRSNSVTVVAAHRIGYASSKVAFSWRFLLDRIQTKKNLRKRKMGKVDGLNCLFCQQAEEFAEHLMFSCKFSYQVWKECYSWIGVKVVLPKDPKSHFWHHSGFIARKKAWWVVWLAVIWSTWLLLILFSNKRREIFNR